MRFSPSSRTRSGGQSGAGSSSDRIAGIQYWRMRLPIGVPGPTRHRSSLSSLLSMSSSSPRAADALVAYFVVHPRGRGSNHKTLRGRKGGTLNRLQTPPS